MSAAVSAPLSSEPSRPQERASQHLPPKSYAEATVEGTDQEAGVLYNADGTAVSDNADGSSAANGLWHNIDEDRVIYDKHTDKKGQKLTSIKPDESYEKMLRHGAESAPRQKGRSGKKQDLNNSKLASGRRAGAGWERSALVCFFPKPILYMLTSTEFAGHH